MSLSLSFVKALFPVVVATSQALAGPGVTTEPPHDEPVVMAVVQNVYATPNARASFADWRKRLFEARSGVTIATVQAENLNQPRALQPL